MDERRTEERERADRRAVLISKDSAATPVHIVDVSRNGIGLESYVDPGLRVGDVAKLKVREHTVNGEVMRLSTAGSGVEIGLRLSTADGLLLA